MNTSWTIEIDHEKQYLYVFELDEKGFNKRTIAKISILDIYKKIDYLGLDN